MVIALLVQVCAAKMISFATFAQISRWTIPPSGYVPTASYQKENFASLSVVYLKVYFKSHIFIQNFYILLRFSHFQLEIKFKGCFSLNLHHIVPIHHCTVFNDLMVTVNSGTPAAFGSVDHRKLNYWSSRLALQALISHSSSPTSLIAQVNLHNPQPLLFMGSPNAPFLSQFSSCNIQFFFFQIYTDDFESYLPLISKSNYPISSFDFLSYVKSWMTPNFLAVKILSHQKFNSKTIQWNGFPRFEDVLNPDILN